MIWSTSKIDRLPLMPDVFSKRRVSSFLVTGLDEHCRLACLSGFSITDEERYAHMKRDILFLCQFFYPEYNSSATLPFDTAKYLAQNGYSVGALCGYPKEYSASRGVPIREKKDGVSIHRLHYAQLNRRSKIGRLINYVSFTLSVLCHMLELKDYRAVMVYSNPPVLPLAAIWANKLFRTRIIFVSYDVYPEVAYSSNSLQQGSLMAKGMERINRSLFRRAAAVVALTDEMREYLLQHRRELSEERITTISNWAHEAELEDKKSARESFGYRDSDFVVAYFGNIGTCQDETALLQAIEQLKDHENIQFLIAGHGNKMPAVRQAAAHLPNVKIYDFLTGRDFEQAVAASSCGIVSLARGLGGMCAPSKYYSYLQGGLPVLVVAEEESYLQKEILQEEIGLFSAVGNGAQLAQNILTLAQESNLQRKMSNNAAALYKRAYAKQVGLNQYDVLCDRVFAASD